MPTPIAQNRFLAAFPESWREHIGDMAVLETLSGGEYVFREGEPADGVVLVLDGQVEVVRELADGQLLVLHTASAGDFLGELAVLDRQGRSASARALGETQIATLPTDPLLHVLQQAPGDAILQLFVGITSQVRASNDRFLREVLQRERLATLGGMAASIIHDFKSPLTGIELASQLLQVKYGEDEAIGKYSQKISQQTARMTALAQELLDFSRGKPDLHASDVPISELFAELVELNEDYLQARSVTLEIEAEEAELWCDRNRLLRVLQNLMSNAVTAFGGQPGALVLGAQSVGGQEIILSLADNGPGIPEDVQSRIFEPFAKSAASKGSGLGMAISKSVVEAHGGSISFTSEAGVGTCFEIRLPLTGTA